MSPIETSGAAGFARGSPHHAHAAFSARSGAQKAQTIQSAATAAAAAPVETARAVAQAQAAQKSQVKPDPRPASEGVIAQIAKPAAKNPNPSLAKPMTAVLLHELRLQQELAHVQEEKEKKPRLTCPSRRAGVRAGPVPLSDAISPALPRRRSQHGIGPARWRVKMGG